MNIELLQCTSMDLEQLVRKEMEENPALEEADRPSEDSDISDPDPIAVPGEVPAGGNLEGDGTVDGPVEQRDAVDPLEAGATLPDEYSVDDFYSQDFYLPPPSNPRGEREPDALDFAPAPGPTLREALMPRLRGVLSEEDAKVAETVLESLDDDGFLAVPEDELAESTRVDPVRLRDILYVIKRIEPGGIACHSQQESFLVQLELYAHPPDSLECRIVAEHWDLLLQQQIHKIKKLCSVSDEELREAIVAIQTLEPRPARRFTAYATEYIAPDFSVVHRDGKFVAIPSDTSHPHLRLAQKYVHILQNPKTYPREQVRFARDKFNRAVMFLKGIESRRRTLARLMELVIEEQKTFFESGPEHLRPATMRDAAPRLNVVPSTVSRAVAGKYVETDFGIFPIKHFFKAGAGDSSRESIKEKVKAIIEGEVKSKPLSDDEICVQLGRESIRIARRTVAKYRNELDIPGRNQRGKL